MIVARVRRFFAEEAQVTGLPIVALVLVAVALHLIVTLRAAQPWHPDEHFQILEFAWARAGLAPVTGLPWEFAARIRSGLQPALAMALLAMMRSVGIVSPFAWTLALRLGTLVVAFVVLLRIFACVSPTLTVHGRRVLWLGGLLLWFAPLFASRFTSENLGGLMLAAALTFVHEERRPRDDGWVAVLLGLSFVFRFQMAFAIVALLVWLVVFGANGWRRAMRIALGVCVVVAIGSLVDAWFYHGWVFTPWEYFRVNLIQGVAASFGASPWYAYFIWIPLWMAPPLGVAIVALILGGAATHRRNPWSWTLAGFLVGHFFVAHKELRFLLPLLYFVPVMVALGWDALERHVAMAGGWRVLVWMLAAQNMVLVAALATPAIHRGKEFDWQYFRFLWDAAEARPGETIYVLNTDGSPYRVWDWEANVYRHPRVVAVDYVPGDSLPAAIPRGTPSVDILVVTRAPGLPRIAGALGYSLVYEDEPGYRTMARWVGAENSGVIRQLETWDRWTGSEWVRRVYRVRTASSP